MSTPAPNPGMDSFFIPASKMRGIEPRLAVSIEGLDKCGKSDWALRTAPGPIALVTNDPGTEYVLQKLRSIPDYAKKFPFVLVQNFEKPDPKVIKAADVDKAEWAMWQKEWKKFEGATDALVSDRTCRTVVIDTASELAQLCELSYFGKLRGNARIDIRTEFNRAMAGWFWKLYKGRPDLNIIMIHRLKKQYAPKSNGGEDAWTGKYEREGFNKAGFLIDIALRTGWDGLKRDFYTEVDVLQATRFGGDLAGQRWYSKDGENGFGWLGMSIFPETENTPEVWGL